MAADSHLDVAIAGGGLLGLLLSWRLLRLGHSVTLFDADLRSGYDAKVKQRSAAHTAAAMISPMSEVVCSEKLVYDMGIHSLMLWQQWLSEPPVELLQFFHQKGSIAVAHEGDMQELSQFHQDLEHHLGADNPSRWLDRDELLGYEPGLSTQFHRGIFLPGEAHLDNREFLQHLFELLLRMGLKVKSQDIDFCSPECLPTAEKGKQFGHWFDCRGMGAKKNLEDLRGVRGEVLWVQSAEVQLSRPIRLMHPRYKIYVVPKPGQQFIVGATEIESEDRSPISLQSSLELSSALYTIHPAFAEARIIEMDTNLRPSLVDNLPQVESQSIPMPGSAKLAYTSLNGLYRHGYLLAPCLVEHALSLLSIREKSQHLNPFSLKNCPEEYENHVTA